MKKLKLFLLLMMAILLVSLKQPDRIRQRLWNCPDKADSSYRL